MRIDLTGHVERLTIPRLLAVATVWVLGFAAIYTILPRFVPAAALADLRGSSVSDFGNALFFSIATATTLGDNLIVAHGWLRALSAVEVLGGVVIAGLVVNSLIAYPSQQLRRSIRACNGWWLERLTVGKHPPFYGFSLITFEGGKLNKSGFNFDPNGKMNKTTYTGQLITEAFPVLFSMYENDVLSSEFTEGILKFEMQRDSVGRYLHYEGSSYDRKGRRDQIVGTKVSDSAIIKKLDGRCISDEEILAVVREIFGKGSDARKFE